jgi:cyclohexanone monooxygenase
MSTVGWQRRWMENFASTQTGRMPDEDLVQDGWTDLAQRIRKRIMTIPPNELTPERMMDAFEESDYEKMEEIRSRIDAIVDDPTTAAGLKAWYRQLCKRPCFHDEYLQAFNAPQTHLVDTDGAGVQRIDESGVIAGGEHYDVDCIIFASGFEVGTPYWRRAGFDVVGCDGVTLSEHWSEGMRTKHGIHTHGFPNAFFVQLTQGANLISNVPHNLSESAVTIASIVAHAERDGFTKVEVTKEAEDEWMELLRSGMTFLGSAECTPGYYNNEGQPSEGDSDSWRGYPLGAVAYFEYIEKWRSDGTFDGLRFSS